MRFYGSQITNEVLAQVWITLGSVGPQNHFVVISPVSGFVIGIDILTIGRISLLALLPKKGQMYPWTSPTRTVNKKQYHIPWGNVKISTAI